MGSRTPLRQSRVTYEILANSMKSNEVVGIPYTSSRGDLLLDSRGKKYAVCFGSPSRLKLSSIRSCRRLRRGAILRPALYVNKLITMDASKAVSIKQRSGVCLSVCLFHVRLSCSSSVTAASFTD